MKKVNWNLENTKFVELTEEKMLTTNGGKISIFDFLPGPIDVIEWLIDASTITAYAPSAC